MDANPTVDMQTIADDFSEAMKGALDQEKIDAAVSKLTAATASYKANGSVASLIFYLRFQVNVKDGKTFDGNAGGASSPGGGTFFGDVYTDDIDRLYSDTVSFQFNCTSVYTSLLFFDKSSNLLGHFQSAAVSTVNGVGGGSGKWS